jgi:hypothetical protein
VATPNQVAEQAPALQSTTAATDQPSEILAEAEGPVQASSDSSSPAVADGLTLAAVEHSWAKVLQAVRQRNPTTQAVLNTGCQPVEVNGDEIVMTFPFAHLLEKLSHPQRQAELHDALSEVFQAQCRIKLVLASQYKPKPQSAQAGHLPTVVSSKSMPPDVHKAADSQSSPAPGARAEKDSGMQNAQVPEEIVRWAEERGGEVSVLPP